MDFQKESIRRPDHTCIGSPNLMRLLCGYSNFARQGFFSLGQGQVGDSVFDSGFDPVLIDGFGKGELTVIFSHAKGWLTFFCDTITDCNDLFFMNGCKKRKIGERG